MAINIQTSAHLRLDKSRKKRFYASVLFMLSFTVTSILACEWALDSTSVSLACGMCIGLLGFPIVMYGREKTPVAPVYLTALFIFIAYPVKLLAVRMYVPGVLEEFEGRLFDDQAVGLVLWMLAAGIFAYYVGYYSTPKFLIRFMTRVRLPVSTHINQRWYMRALVVSLIGWGCFAFQISAQTWSSFAGLGESWDPRYNQLLSYLFNYVWYGMIAAAVWLSFRNLKRSWSGIVVSAGLIITTLVIVLLLMGSKTWLMSPFLYLFAVLYMNKRRLPFWLMGSVTFLVMLFAFTFVPKYRTNYIELDTGSSSSVSDFYQTGNRTLSQLDDAPVNTSDSVAGMFNRFGGIDNAVRVMEVVPQPLEYFYFSDLLSLPFSFVPRLVFPWKPNPETPTAYTREVAGMVNGGSAAPFPVAEGYINLGWLGVIILFWLWGVYQSVLFNGFYLPRSDNAVVQVLYAFLMVQAVGFGNWITGLFLGTPGQLITLVPLIFVFGGFSGRKLLPSARRNRNRTQPAYVMFNRFGNNKV
jgi:hypothetical protein